MTKEQKIARMKERLRRAPRKKNRTPVYPIAVERQHASTLLMVINECIKDLDRYAKLAYDTEMAGRKADSWQSSYDRQKLRKKLKDRIDDSRGKIRRNAKVLDKTNKRALGDALGIDVVFADRNLMTMANVWVETNVHYITALASREIDDVGNLVREATVNNLSYSELQQQIFERTDITRRHAELIARDQVAKLNSQITGERFRELGITRERWRTSKDERVRRSHAEMEGIEYDPTNPPIVDGERVLPGQPIQCRCRREPVINWLE